MSLVPFKASDFDCASDPVGMVLAWCERGREALVAAQTLVEASA